MKTARRLDNVQEYYFSKKLTEIRELEKDGHSILNLGIGSPDLPPHESVIEELQKVVIQPGVHQYQSYRGVPELREAISAFHLNQFETSVDPATEILPLMGSKEGITHISMAFLDEGDGVLIPEVGYPTYTSVTRMVQAKPVYYPLKETGEPDWEFFENLDFHRIRLIWINYPHMPTGTSGSSEIFERILQLATKQDLLVVHDNPYCFIQNHNPMSILQNKESRDRCLELHSFSKSFNMAGWRVGWLAGSKKLIDAVLRIKSNMDSGMFKPIQMAATKALSLDSTWFESLNKVYSRRKAKVYQLLDLLHASYSTDQAGLFVWAKVEEDVDSLVDQLLYEKGVFITPGHIFGKAGGSHIRISLCCEEQVYQEAIDRIK